MKPSSLATILLRFVALYLIVHGAFSLVVPTILTQLVPNSAVTVGGVLATSAWGGILQIQLAMAALWAIVGILLYLWSHTLGRLIARGLD